MKGTGPKNPNEDRNDRKADPGTPKEAPRIPKEDPPPFGRSWPVLYAIVLLNLILVILLSYIFTRTFS